MFLYEEHLIETMEIPVFHDDQHGTAIISIAALLNALEVQNKKIDQVKVVTQVPVLQDRMRRTRHKTWGDAGKRLYGRLKRADLQGAQGWHESLQGAPGKR